MKITFILAIISLVFLNVFAQKKMTDREFNGLQGRVKSVYIEDADLEIVKGKTIVKNRAMQFDELYDENGNMTQSSMYYMGDRNIFSFIDGEKISKSADFYSPTASKAVIVASGKKQSKSPDARYDKKYQYEYDTKGRIIEERKYRSDGTLFFKSTYKYNDAGNPVEQVLYSDEKVSENYYYTYDSKGNLIELKFVPTGINGETNITIHRFKDYKFDAQGNWIQRTQTTVYTDGEGRKKENQSIYYRKIEYYK
jgi:hypothetical protein